MAFRRTVAGNLFISVGAAAALMGCAATPLGPTVSVMPGHGKSFDAFQSDQANCKGFAANQVKGQADAANQRAVGTAVLSTLLTAGLGAAVGGAANDAGAGAAVGSALGAAGGAAFGAGNTSNDQMNIQQQYDNAFSQCMYAKGEQVPGFAPSVAYRSADPLVQSTQGELIRLGYLRGTADGVMGDKTRSAIAGFEQANGMPADGSPSPQLLARLQSTTTGGGSGATASSGGWVTPGASRSTTTAAGSSDWVAPSGSPAVTPAAATSGGWVSPSK